MKKIRILLEEGEKKICEIVLQSMTEDPAVSFFPGVGQF